jgi:hypothetical protein
MSLKPYIYDDPSYVELSIDGALTTPLKTTHNGKDGDVRVVKVFLRNTSSSVYYKDIQVTPIDSDGADIYEDVEYTQTGWGVKLKQGNTEPSFAEWDDIAWANTIDIPDLGGPGSPDTSTYEPFWYLVTCPPSSNADNKTDIQIKVEYIEEAV